MRITVIEHEADAGLGYLGRWLELPCDVVRPYRGEPVPEAAADGFVVLGGEAAAWEDERWPWLPATRELLRRSVADATPTLAVCLGAQLLTLACGGTVERGGNGLEAGVSELTALPQAASDPLFAGIAARPGPVPAVQYHGDAMTRLPDGAVPLMTGAQYPNQAYRLGPAAWAVQFHPEATPDIFASWTAATGLESAGRLDEQVRAAAPALESAWRPLAEAFTATIRAAARQRAGDLRTSDRG
ncbi:type 1 glutamine amidotransferase [Nonomuraea sp. NPDC023979]|uniref:type 1 glutamine amidotransferase n=1 Tax=Nonomuraea sp. NPDC023979 TaxID=3154796 RepID=UPI0033D1E313